LPTNNALALYQLAGLKTILLALGMLLLPK
jgi:hypothetical protein